MKIDKDCYSLIAGYLLGTAAFAALVWWLVPSLWWRIPLLVLALVFAFFVVWFHRVPNREKVGGPTIVTSVADGKVVIVEKVYEKEYLRQECIQVSVYMNFFDVHANFWPVSGKISYYQYHPGKYLLAFLPKAAEENEHSSVAVSTDHGEVFFKQIAGTFARRIVCYAKEGMEVESGAQCGIIKFGSRIDMFLPVGADIKVQVGDLTRACETVIAEI